MHSKYLYFICLCTYAIVHSCRLELVLSSIMWVPGIGLKSLRCETNAFYLPNHLADLPYNLIFKYYMLECNRFPGQAVLDEIVNQAELQHTVVRGDYIHQCSRVRMSMSGVAVTAFLISCDLQFPHCPLPASGVLLRAKCTPSVAVLFSCLGWFLLLHWV